MTAKNIPAIPTNFEIYSSMEGADAVTAELAAALTVCRDEVLKVNETADVGPKLLNTLIKANILPLFKKYSQYGCSDSEPRHVVAGYLVRLLVSIGAISDFAKYDVRDELCI